MNGGEIGFIPDGISLKRRTRFALLSFSFLVDNSAVRYCFPVISETVPWDMSWLDWFSG